MKGFDLPRDVLMKLREENKQKYGTVVGIKSEPTDSIFAPESGL
jgi:hypothetical protein